MLINQHILDELNQNHLVRNRCLVENRFNGLIKIKGKWVNHFCSNDYLNIATHPKIKKAFVTGVNRYGLGSGASSLVSGYYKPHAALEEAFAEFLHRDRAVLFNSGYHANLGVLQTFANRNTVVIADKLCHASLIDGIILSRAKHYRYSELQTTLIEKWFNTSLQKKHKNFLIVTEGVFSMEGRIADIPQLAAIATKHSALLIVDDAHALGVLGQHGRGSCDYFNVTQKEVPCLITPLGKGLGSLGAIVSGSHSVIEPLLQFARTYRYTTALPPAVSVATLAALKLIQQEPWRSEHVRFLSVFFNAEAEKRGLNLSSIDPTPVKCILVGSNKKVLDIQSRLFEKGFMVSAIRPPTVPKNTARLRICLNYLHNETQIIALLDHIHSCFPESSPLCP